MAAVFSLLSSDAFGPFFIAQTYTVDEALELLASHCGEVAHACFLAGPNFEPAIRGAFAELRAAAHRGSTTNGWYHNKPDFRRTVVLMDATTGRRLATKITMQVQF